MQQAGQDAEDHLRGLRITEAKATALLERPFATSWAKTGSGALSQKDSRVFTQAEKALADEIAQIIKQANKAGHRLRLIQLAEAFDLTQFELDTFLICLAPALDLRYEQIYGYLQDDLTQKQATVNLILDLLCEPGTARLGWLGAFSPDATLLQHRLIEFGPQAHQRPLLAQTLLVNRDVLLWLIGQPSTINFDNSTSKWTPNPATITELLTVDTVTLQRFGSIMQETQALLMGLHGPDLLAQRAVAQHLVQLYAHPLLTLSLNDGKSGRTLRTGEGAEPTPAPNPFDDVQLQKMELSVIEALRDARLNHAVLAIEQWHTALIDDVPLPNLWRHLIKHPLPIMLLSPRSWQARGVAVPQDHLLHQLAVPTPGYEQRKIAWVYFLEQQHTPSILDEADHAALASEFQLTFEQIRDATSTAREMIAQTPTMAQLQAAARAQSIPTIAGLVHQIQPRHQWDDIVLPNDQKQMLSEMIAMIRHRGQVLGKWGLGQKLTSSHGVCALFAGPPGTGKTMAAEVIASKLGIDLYRIDLSTIVSKYIGETEKNLEKIFTAAERSNAILFFDEADAIFGKRSEVKDAHDRYANMEVGYLLQRMERYDGVTILATNLRANLDDAFTRRLHFAIDFPFPDEAQRLLMWQTLFPRGAPCMGELDFAGLARQHKVTGGVIRNIVVNACYLAADGKEGGVTQAHLLHATRRELQKMGRLQD